MKTLIFNGSPRKKGDTAALIDVLKSSLDGEIKQIDAYFADIKPCMDCRFCKTHSRCSINDEMESVFSMIDEADNIVIASPIYFSEITGPLLSIFSRLQYIYISKIHRNCNILSDKKRNGIILLAGGGNGSPDKAAATSRCIMHTMKAEVIETICSTETDNLPASLDMYAAELIKKAAAKIRLQKI